MKIPQPENRLATDATVRLVGIEKRYENGFNALQGIDLTIRDHELLVLLGPSGCGKSTTLNILAGLEVPSAGQLYFGNRLVNNVPPEERDVSMIFQSIALYPHMNSRRNIEFALRRQRVPYAVIDERVVSISKLLAIEKLLDRKIHQLSGGQRQRIAIAKALVRRPRLFLLDEPFTALDADMRRQLRSELVRLHHELDTTMVFVTHDQEEAMSIADRIAVMCDGKLVQVGAPLEIYFEPVDLWTAQFVGSQPINVLALESTTSAGVAITGVREALPAPAWLRNQVDASGGNGLLAGLRPEAVDLEPDREVGPLAPCRGEVVSRQVLGGSTLYEVDLGAPAVVRALVGSNNSVPIGAQVTLKFHWERSLLFDRLTRLRIPGAISRDGAPATDAVASSELDT